MACKDCLNITKTSLFRESNMNRGVLMKLNMAIGHQLGREKLEEKKKIDEDWQILEKSKGYHLKNL